jgi:hypothetical protein
MHAAHLLVMLIVAMSDDGVGTALLGPEPKPSASGAGPAIGLAPSRMDGVRRALDYPGRNPVERLTAALADAPNHGVVLLQSDSSVRITRDVVLNKPVTLFVSAPEVVLAEGANLIIAANSVSIEGVGRIPVRLSEGSAIAIGSPQTPVFDWSLSSFHLSPLAPALFRSAAIILDNAREGYIRRIYAGGFSSTGASALEVRDNSWSNRVSESFFVRSAHGISFRGSETNAFVISGCNISHNEIGLLFNGGSMHGISVIGGTQIEGNKTGLSVEAGTIHALTLSDIYVESPAETVFIAARSTGKRPLVLRLVVTGGYVYSESPYPLVFVATKAQDFISATLSGLSVTTRLHDPRLARATGTRASVSVVETTIRSGNVYSITPVLSSFEGATVRVR